MPFTPAGLLVVTMVLLGTVGFIDDYLKIRNQRSLGLTKTAKFAGQAFAAIVLGVGAWYCRCRLPGRLLHPPHRRHRAAPDPVPGLGVPAGVGHLQRGQPPTVRRLASGRPCWWSAPMWSRFWQFRHLCGAWPTPSAATSSRPASPQDLGHRGRGHDGVDGRVPWWNAPPARTMGDTGSLALGGTLAALALFTNTQLLLAVLGGLVRPGRSR